MPSFRVLGVVPTRPAAEQLVGNLRLAGFGQDEVSFIVVKREARENLTAKTADQTGRGARKVLRGVLRGALIGLLGMAVLGFAAHRLFDLSVLPQGVIIGLFSGVGFIIGGLAGAFSTETPSTQVIERYGMELREGQVVLTVDAPDADVAKTAEEILNTSGATKVNSFMVQEEQLNQALKQDAGVAEVRPQGVRA